MPRVFRPFILLILLLLGALAFHGCSDAVGPTDAEGDLARIGAEGDLDPADGTFVLKTLDLPPPWDGPPARIQLVGSNLQIDATDETVSLDVAIRSLHPEPLYAPAAVWVQDLEPEGVTLLNADWMVSPPDPPGKAQGDTFEFFVHYGYDYADLLGEDGMLEFEEVSESKTWIFHDPGLVSISFHGMAEFGMAPDLPRIAGRCFADLNNDGHPDPTEPALHGSWVTVTLPDGDVADVMPDEDGWWALPVDSAGLYQVRCDLMWAVPWLPCWTTPNPREVLLLPGPDGTPQGFEQAHFGLCEFGPVDPPPIVFTDLPVEELHFGHWTLISARVEEPHTLHMHVGFSGCQPDHPWTLFAHNGYMESLPPQINVVLRHGVEEDCDAWFETDLTFDLGPLWIDFVESYGPGELIMNLIGFDGTVTPVSLFVYPPD